MSRQHRSRAPYPGWCNSIGKGPAAGTAVDVIKAQCDANAACDGFTVRKDLSSSFFCAFTPSPTGPADVFIKLPNATGCGASKFSCDEKAKQCVADAAGVFSDKASCEAKC